METVEPREWGLVDDYFVAAEAAAVGAAPAEERALLTNLVWSAKESVLKALREGLRRDTRTVVVEWNARGEGWNPLRCRCLLTCRRFDGWWESSGGFVRTILADRALATPRRVHV